MKKNVRSGGIALVAAVTSVAILSGCTGDEVAECERILEQTVTSVAGVDSAEFTCRRNFGDSGERGTVALSAGTQQEATPIIENIYRAFAAEDRIDGVWRPYVTFASAGGGDQFDDDALEFNGTPVVDDLRDRYDIHPPGAD